MGEIFFSSFVESFVPLSALDSFHFKTVPFCSPGQGERVHFAL